MFRIPGQFAHEMVINSCVNFPSLGWVVQNTKFHIHHNFTSIPLPLWLNIFHRTYTQTQSISTNNNHFSCFIHVLLTLWSINCLLSVAWKIQCHVVQLLLANKTNYKRYGMKGSQNNLGYYTGVCMEGLGGKKNSSDGRFPGRDLKPRPTKYKEELPTRPSVLKDQRILRKIWIFHGGVFICMIGDTSTLKREASSSSRTILWTTENVTKYLRLNIYIAH